MATRRYGRHTVETSNEAKPLFPEAGITKGELIDYYESLWPVLRRHLRDRPLVLQRFPDGIAAAGFYQKQVPDHYPDWIRRVEVEKREGGRQQLVVADRVATLAYLGQQAALTLHPWLSRADRLDHPDQLVIDLDPPAKADFDRVRRAALQVRALLDELGLTCWVKTTGSKGVHVVVPLDRSEGFDAVRGFASDAMQLLAARHADTLTTEQRKAKRRGRLYLDVARNAYAQTAVAPYSVRALPGAPVATPITWQELARSDVRAQRWSLRSIPRRLARREDPWAGMQRRARSLAAARERLDALRAEAGAADGR